MGKLQGRDKLILAFMAAGVMLGTAWAANENPYPNGGTIDLTKINNEDVYRPEANGVNTVNISGDLGTKDALDARTLKFTAQKTSPETPRLSWTGRRSCIPRARCSFSPEAMARM